MAPEDTMQTFCFLERRKAMSAIKLLIKAVFSWPDLSVRTAVPILMTMGVCMGAHQMLIWREGQQGLRSV